MKKGITRLLSGIVLAAVIIVSPVSAAFAEGESGTGTSADAAAQSGGNTGTAAAQPLDRETERQNGYAMIPDTNNLTGWPAGPQTYGHAAIVMDMNSGAIVYGKNINEQRYPASITKLLTALVALENSSLTDQVTITEDSISCLTSGDAHIGMQPREIISMEDALYALLLASANEVAHAIAETVGKEMGGDYNTFIQAMNDKAKELGCTNSHWVNPNGLHDDQHYTTAHDMALSASAIYQYDEFRKITQTMSYTIGPTNLVNESRTFQQKHMMLASWDEDYYEYATGGKTGYTDKSRTTLVTMADNGELQLAAVVLYDFGADAYADTRAMFEYVFNNFSKVKLNDQEKPEEIASYSDEDAYVLLPAGISFADLEKTVTVTDASQGTGKVSFTYEGQNVGSADVILASDYVTSVTGKADPDPEAQKENGGFPLWAKILTGCVAGIVAVFAVLTGILLYRKEKRRRMRRRRRRQQGRRQQERSRMQSRNRQVQSRSHRTQEESRQTESQRQHRQTQRRR